MHSMLDELWSVLDIKVMICIFIGNNNKLKEWKNGYNCVIEIVIIEYKWKKDEKNGKKKQKYVSINRIFVLYSFFLQGEIWRRKKKEMSSL